MYTIGNCSKWKKNNNFEKYFVVSNKCKKVFIDTVTPDVTKYCLKIGSLRKKEYNTITTFVGNDLLDQFDQIPDCPIEVDSENNCLLLNVDTDKTIYVQDTSIDSSHNIDNLYNKTLYNISNVNVISEDTFLKIKQKIRKKSFFDLNRIYRITKGSFTVRLDTPDIEHKDFFISFSFKNSGYTYRYKIFFDHYFVEIFSDSTISGENKKEYIVKYESFYEELKFLRSDVILDFLIQDDGKHVVRLSRDTSDGPSIYFEDILSYPFLYNSYIFSNIKIEFNQTDIRLQTSFDNLTIYYPKIRNMNNYLFKIKKQDNDSSNRIFYLTFASVNDESNYNKKYVSPLLCYFNNKFKNYYLNNIEFFYGDYFQKTINQLHVDGVKFIHTCEYMVIEKGRMFNMDDELVDIEDQSITVSQYENIVIVDINQNDTEQKYYDFIFNTLHTNDVSENNMIKGNLTKEGFELLRNFFSAEEHYGDLFIGLNLQKDDVFLLDSTFNDDHYNKSWGYNFVVSKNYIQQVIFDQEESRRRIILEIKIHKSNLTEVVKPDKEYFYINGFGIYFKKHDSYYMLSNNRNLSPIVFSQKNEYLIFTILLQY